MYTEAIIIKRQHNGEYDQLITCYTRAQGKRTAVAKSALKPSSVQGMQLDALNLVEFELVNGRSLPIITGAQCQRSFPGIRSSRLTWAAAYFFLDVVDKAVFDHQEDAQLWHFLRETLETLDALPAGRVLSWFPERQAAFLQVLGYGQHMDGRYANLDTLFHEIAGKPLTSLAFMHHTVRTRSNRVV